MKPTLEDYFKDIPKDDHPIDEDNIFLYHDLFTDMMTEAVCIIDFQQRTFYDVADHGFFLCGHSRSEVKSMGYEFFDEIIHPDDLFLWSEMHNAILKYIYEKDFEKKEVYYFTCTIRIKSSFQFRKTPYYIISDVRLRPVFVNRILKYGLCFFTASAVKTTGNLCVYFKERTIYCEYSHKKKWVDNKKIKLSLREKEILMLTQNGLNREGKAKMLCVSIKTIDSATNRLFEKCNAKNMMQAEKIAASNRLIYDKKLKNYKKQK